MPELFGTDGARGVANTELTCDIAFKLGQAAVKFFGPSIVLGRDTRLSGQMLEASVSAGIMSMGGTVHACGIIPTPGVALLARELDAQAGIVVSASHNPPEYNGIKFFDGDGFKLPVSLEEQIEAFVQAGGAKAADLPAGDAVGCMVTVDDAIDRYIDNAVRSIAERGVRFDGIKIALDTGHGAASVTTEAALTRLGATVVTINDDFNGTDINVECGSTHLEPLRELVLSTHADFGIAHDGDADRVMFVDETGAEIDGDVIEAVCATDLKERGRLSGATVVSTVMCNLGFVYAMRDAGINVVQTAVGDRNVLTNMREHGYVLGGEQSGHVIFMAHNTTGDGLVTACQFIAACVRCGQTCSQAAAVMTRFPQELINVRVADKKALAHNEVIEQSVATVEARLGDAGRVLVRPSGTEPLIRVMVEAQDPNVAGEAAREIADVVTAESVKIG